MSKRPGNPSSTSAPPRAKIPRPNPRAPRSGPKRPGRPGDSKGDPASKRQRTVKKEKNELVERCRRLFASKAPGFITDVDISKEFGLEQRDAVQLINKLLSNGRISVHTDGGAPLYSWVSEAERLKSRQKSVRLKGLSQESKHIYQEIEAAAEKGIGMRDLKFKTNYPGPLIRKALDTMAGKALIKWVHTIQAKNVKIWMLKDIEPSREVKGGPWYEDGEYEHNIVTTLYKACEGLVAKKEQTAQSVTDAINRAGLLVGKTLHAVDVEYVLSALELDGKLEGYHKAVSAIVKKEGQSTMTRGKEYVYRKKKGGTIDSPFTSVPCCVCPVADKCAEGQEINPTDCAYFGSWLDF